MHKSGILLGTAGSVVSLPYSTVHELSNAECGSFLSCGGGGPFGNSHIHDMTGHVTPEEE